MRFGYNEYMAHHYAYMTRVAEVREPESYAETAKDANWRAAIEEEMHALVLIIKNRSSFVLIVCYGH